MACFSIYDLTPISTTSGLWSTGNTRKYQQIDVYIYQSGFGVPRKIPTETVEVLKMFSIWLPYSRLNSIDLYPCKTSAGCDKQFRICLKTISKMAIMAAILIAVTSPFEQIWTSPMDGCEHKMPIKYDWKMKIYFQHDCCGGHIGCRDITIWTNLMSWSRGYNLCFMLKWECYLSCS